MGTKYSRFARGVLDAVIRPSIRRSFHGLYLGRKSIEVSRQVPLLIISNHMSWWDGFLLLELQRLIRPQAKIYTIALHDTLREHPFLGRVGLVPLDPKSPSSFKKLLSFVRSKIRETETGDSAPIFVFFPQGRITPAWVTPLEFQRGVELLLREFEHGGVLPVGLWIEPLNQKRPSVFISCGSLIELAPRPTLLELSQSVSAELDWIKSELQARGEKVLSDEASWIKLKV